MCVCFFYGMRLPLHVPVCVSVYGVTTCIYYVRALVSMWICEAVRTVRACGKRDSEGEKEGGLRGRRGTVNHITNQHAISLAQPRSKRRKTKTKQRSKQ